MSIVYFFFRLKNKRSPRRGGRVPHSRRSSRLRDTLQLRKRKNTFLERLLSSENVGLPSTTSFFFFGGILPRSCLIHTYSSLIIYMYICVDKHDRRHECIQVNQNNREIRKNQINLPTYSWPLKRSIAVLDERFFFST
jgi:hypothetical protein